MHHAIQRTLVTASTLILWFAAGCTSEHRQASSDEAETPDPVIETIPFEHPSPHLAHDGHERIAPQDPREGGNEPAPVTGAGDEEGQTSPAWPRASSQAVPMDRALKSELAKGPHGGVTFHAHTPSLAPDSVRMAREPLYRERYRRPDDNRVTRVSDNPVSTFSIDVDTGAYTNMRRWLNQGQLPPQDAVRIEEFINYFDYAYAPPRNSTEPFAVHTETAPTPWNADTRLLRIGIQGYQVPKEQLPASNLVFLVDVSGSMRAADKLPLLKQALGMLARQLDADDRIGIVVYAGASGMALQPTSGDNHAAIQGALHRLEAGGSTNGAAGIRLAYQLAQQHYIPGGVNRVILATDGDFNVGLASTEELIDLIQRKRDAGIALTTLGFGTGNYNDHLLEQLADEGNGNYAYIDRLSEARKVLSEELSATLLTIARDVKIQVEFNPATVAEYRLIGYENRNLNEEDFNNDRVDAGEIGAGHRVTALYEISLRGSGHQRLPQRRYPATNAATGRRDHTAPYADELAHLRIRYKLPGRSESTLIETPVPRSAMLADASRASDDFRFAAAVAAFGQKLRGGQYLESWSYGEILELARQSRGADPFGYRSEFLQLLALADSIDAADRVAQGVPGH